MGNVSMLKCLSQSWRMCKNIAGRINSDMSSLIGQKDWSTSRLYEVKLELAYSKAAGANLQKGFQHPL